MRAKWIRVALWSALAPGAALLALSFFCGIYRVGSGSMEPTLHGSPEDGDFVLVWFDRSPELERFDLVVLERGDSDEGPLVKRVLGLPGEKIQLASGDLYVEGELLPRDAPRPPLVPVFDDRIHDFNQVFYVEPSEAIRWIGTVDGRRLDARGARNVRAKLRRLFDDHLAPDGERVQGRNPANDGAVGFTLRIDEPWQRFVVQMTEESDEFLCELVPASPGRATVRLVRRWLRADTGEFDQPRTLEVTEVAFELGRAHALRMSNIDNVLAVEVDGATVLSSAYDANTAPGQRVPGAYFHLPPRLEIGGDDVVAEIGGLTVWRDIPYYESGEHASGRPETLALYEVFVVGDNSGESRDSRQWGPVPLEDVLGKPVAVVWPPSRWRRLRPTAR